MQQQNLEEYQRTLPSAAQAQASTIATAPEEEERLYVTDSGVYSSANMQHLNAAGIWWISRVPETLAQAKAALARMGWRGLVASYPASMRADFGRIGLYTREGNGSVWSAVVRSSLRPLLHLREEE